MLCERDRHRGTESRTGAPAFTGLSVISFTSTVDWVTSILMSSVVQIARFSETMAPRTKYVAHPEEFVAFQGELERHWRLLALEIDPLIGDCRGVWERRADGAAR